MKINDPEGYFESLRKLERNVYMLVLCHSPNDG